MRGKKIKAVIAIILVMILSITSTPITRLAAGENSNGTINTESQMEETTSEQANDGSTESITENSSSDNTENREGTETADVPGSSEKGQFQTEGTNGSEETKEQTQDTITTEQNNIPESVEEAETEEDADDADKESLFSAVRSLFSMMVQSHGTATGKSGNVSEDYYKGGTSTGCTLGSNLPSGFDVIELEVLSKAEGYTNVDEDAFVRVSGNVFMDEVYLYQESDRLYRRSRTSGYHGIDAFDRLCMPYSFMA